MEVNKMELKKNATELNDMILKGKLMDAFEKFYDDSVIMQENDDPPTKGKSANREREMKMMSMIEQFHGAKLNSVAFGDDVVMAEWTFDMAMKGMGRVKRNQVSVQHWKNGGI